MIRPCLAVAITLAVSLSAFAGGSPRPQLEAQTQKADGKYYPVDQLEVGQKGYGLTVFQGNAIERFDVEVLGLVEGMPNPKQKLIIARLSGGGVARTKVFAGMSGSPVYFDGKLAGAVAYSFAFATEPIAGITPIAQMVDQLKDASTAPRVSSGRLSFSDMVASRGGESPLLSLAHLPARTTVPMVAGAASPLTAQYAGQVLQPIATPLAFSGIPQAVLDQVAPDFMRLGILPVAGLGGGGDLGPLVPSTDTTLRPGSSVVVQLIRGDFKAAATGTVTERDGDHIFAFGHPFLSLGATQMPMAESNVVTVVPSANNSFKIATATNLVGAIGQDRSSGIGGRLGQIVPMIPVRVSLKTSRGETQSYNYEVIADPSLAPVLVNMTLWATLGGTERQVGDQTIDVRGRIRVAGQPEIALENRFSAASNAAQFASLSVTTPLAILMGSGFKDVKVDGIDVEITASEERSVGTLTRLLVDKTRVGRGETLVIQAFARTEDGRQFVERIPIDIPRDVPIGKLGIIVGDGASLVASDETLANFVPENLRNLVDAINKLKKNDRLYVKLVRATGGALIDNEPLTALPPSVLASLGSPRASGGYSPLLSSTLLERELPPARFVIAGQKDITVNVVR
jgi:hypothetical protein